MKAHEHDKDAVLYRLGERHNVAQFASFAGVEAPKLRFQRIHGLPDDWRPEGLKSAVLTLLGHSGEHRVNVRTVVPGEPTARGRVFRYGLEDRGAIIEAIREVTAAGEVALVNETIDVDDGGVSGVVAGSVIEFAPGDTPRCVEKSGTVSLVRHKGLRLLERVYGFAPNLPSEAGDRLEFSIHPKPRGFHHERTITWEAAEEHSPPSRPMLIWPNHFSRFIGDKVFGLLVADLHGLPVPSTQVLPRNLPPFSFGRDSGGIESWVRTCPPTPVPGHFTTVRGWVDPFALLAEEDPNGTGIASVLVQQGVASLYAGASFESAKGQIVVEGVSGVGDEFMLGRRAPEKLPSEVIKRVHVIHEMAREFVGPARFEWADDGEVAWVVQMHQGAQMLTGHVLVEGDASRTIEIAAGSSLDEVRGAVERARNEGAAVVVAGAIGLTSHTAEILRDSGVPSRIEPMLDKVETKN